MKELREEKEDKYAGFRAKAQRQVENVKKLLQEKGEIKLVVISTKGDIVHIDRNGKIEVASERNHVIHDISLEEKEDCEELQEIWRRGVWHHRFGRKDPFTGEYY
ncbi:hypothetical protein KJA15_02980 [Patescibacteria group bacterium]|nr:hypothetical protein [Patescibacteria group bacterium]